jgi:hypothetical protein
VSWTRKHSKRKPTHKGEVSTEAKLDNLIEAFHRATEGSPTVSRLDRMKSYALFGRDALESLSDEGMSVVLSKVGLQKCLSESNLSRPFDGTNSLNGRI